MKIYKEKQYLIFDFEDGKTVRYDFATKTAIGKKGKPVKNLCSQLSGLTIDEMCEYCTDKQYGKFLRFVKRRYSDRGYPINNIGTILDKVPQFARFEQIFSAGIDDIKDNCFYLTINDIPKGLIKLCKNHKIKLSDNIVSNYKNNPDAFNLVYDLKYMSLDDKDIYEILDYNSGYYHRPCYTFFYLINDCGYTTKALIQYLDYLKTFEAIDDMKFMLREIKDYVDMMKELSPKFEKYPRHFLTTHKIACRNYNRLKQQFEEERFQKRINKDMEKNFGKYCFIYPKSTQDIKTEAVSQNNCVASYIQKVIDGRCHILFLRLKDMPDESLVTIEVQNGKIVQAKQKYNYPVTADQQKAIDQWNYWYENKNKLKEKQESEELKNGN